LRKRCLVHGSVDALPVPGYAHHFIMLGKARSPESNKKTSTHPSHKVGVNRAGTPEPIFWKSFPLTAGSQDEKNGFENLPWRHGFSASSGFACVILARFALDRWNQRCNSFPKSIGYFP
jgi:hypothetical protein